VPPEVTTGRDLVLVGGDVVVVGGDVVVVDDVDPEVGAVVGGDVVEGTCAGTVFEGWVAPGCSFATTTPMAMVAPVASKAAARVNRRIRAWARRLDSGELN
jgi:hypothetical protein